MALLDGAMLLGLETGRRGENGRFTLEPALDGDIVRPDEDHVTGGIVYGDPRQNHGGFTHFDFPAKFTVDSRPLHNDGMPPVTELAKSLALPEIWTLP